MAEFWMSEGVKETGFDYLKGLLKGMKQSVPVGTIFSK